MDRPGIVDRRLTAAKAGHSQAAARAGQRAPHGPRQEIVQILCRAVLLLLVAVVSSGRAIAQVHDGFDGGLPRWKLDKSDCRARITNQQVQVRGGRDGRGCEAITVATEYGTFAWLAYPVAPAAVIEECRTRLWVHAVKSGLQLAIRVRFPHATDPVTRASIAVILRGTSYTRVGEWEELVVEDCIRQLNLQQVNLRSEFGPNLDLSDPFIDCVLLNSYTGPGVSTLKFDELSFDGFVPLESIEIGSRSGDILAVAATGPATPQRVFTRAIEWRGESFEWLASLGFNTMVLAQEPTENQLQAARRTGLRLVVPPPLEAATTGIDPTVGTRGIVAAYYLGSSLDEGQLRWAGQQRQQLLTGPPAARLPLLAAPAESLRAFAGLTDGLVIDMPPPWRGMRPEQEWEWVQQRIADAGRPSELLLGVATDPPWELRKQLEAAALDAGLGTPNDFGWHSLWLQVWRGMQLAPRGIWFRSTSPLDARQPADVRRATALRIINRQLQALEPFLIDAAAGAAIGCRGAPYQARELQLGATRLIIATSTDVNAAGWPLAGDGRVLELQLNGGTGIYPLRITNFTPQRLERMSDGSSDLGIVSPDLVEFILISPDPQLASRLADRLAQAGRDTVLDRWQLTDEGLEQLAADRQAAITARVIDPRLVSGAEIPLIQRTLFDAEQIYRSGQLATAQQLVKRADAWVLRSRRQLGEVMWPPDVVDWPAACPPALIPGGLPQLLHAISTWRTPWRPMLIPGGGGFEQPELLQQSGWTEDRRLEQRVGVEVAVNSRQPLSGRSALRVSTWPLDGREVPGGYGGTAVRIQSPPLTVASPRWVRIDAFVRVPMGFAGLERGLLVYDNFGGAELGRLVGPGSQWRPVRLYRFVDPSKPLRVVFEVVGGGEAEIDEFAVYELVPEPPLPLEPYWQQSAQPEPLSETGMR